MHFRELPLSGVYVIDIKPVHDERGFFARNFCEKEFAEHGLVTNYVQSNISFNKRKGTLRGMHYQAPPHAETKLVRCTKGSIWDVVIDLRPDSPTFTQWSALELTERNRKGLYVPGGFAHGYQTLEDNSEVFYLMSEFFRPESYRGVRWDDPAFGIDWPPADRTISLKDLQFPDFL